jgi:hypothetical protein
LANVHAWPPLYLQLIDRPGHTVQSMRSWATLVPDIREYIRAGQPQ